MNTEIDAILMINNDRFSSALKNAAIQHTIPTRAVLLALWARSLHSGRELMASSDCRRFLSICEQFATRQALCTDLKRLQGWAGQHCAHAVHALHGSVDKSAATPLTRCRFEALGAAGTRGAVFKCFGDLVYLYLRGKFEHHLARLAVEPAGQKPSGVVADDGRFATLCSKLHDLGMQHLLIDGFMEIVHGLVVRKVETTCRGRFDSPQLMPTREWLRNAVLPWLNEVLGVRSRRRQCVPAARAADDGRGAVSSGAARSRAQWRTRLEFLLYETFCTLRIAELFDIIAEYPESIPALDDLSAALAYTHQHNVVAPVLRYQFGRRLLHPGANTNQVLDVYISTFKALRHLDASGVLLEAVSAPIKLYLRSRKDTVRCIVTSFTEDNRSELFEEFTRSSGGGSGHGNTMLITHGDDADDEEAGPGERWEPDPIDADPTKTSRSRTSGDILSMLVQIYGSKELFVKEYKLILADKLLSNIDYETEKEVRNLELLKLRFGESNMHSCEIMLKDVSDSKRLNLNICGQAHPTNANTAATPPANNALQSGSFVDAMIVSRHFWPTIHGRSFKIHPRADTYLSQFSTKYSVLKAPRELEWKLNLGMVELDLVFGGEQKHEFRVDPLHASLLLHFEDSGRWSAEQLATETGLAILDLKKKMMLWVNYGVVQVSPAGAYEVVPRLSERDGLPGKRNGMAMVVSEGDEADKAVSAEEQMLEQMKVFEQYIVGMLTNLGALPLLRIHNMLKMFASGEYDKNPDELLHFLNELVDAGKLEHIGGMYSIAPPAG